MNIAESFRLIKPKIVKKPSTVNDAALKAVFKAISEGFNMTIGSIVKKSGFSATHVGVAVNQLFARGCLSRINITDRQFAYTVIKPLGEL